MKVLLVHNFYGSSAPSGENTVFHAEAELLLRNGHEVIEFTRQSDDIRGRGFVGAVQGGLSAPWNLFAERKLRRLLERQRPQVMHAHNTFPLLSPAVFHAAGGLETATVLTLHNYRTFCAAGTPVRDGIACTECLDRRSILPAIRYGCYRGSRMATVPMAAMIGIHRAIGTWQRRLDAFIALTEFQRDRLVSAGLPQEAVYIKPHFYPNPPVPEPWDTREDKVIYIGRLAAYKGVHILIEAWKIWGNTAPMLEIVGDGPEKKALERMAERCGGRISFTGQLSFSETQRRLARARLLILPSVCFEGFPMAIREAFALGVPTAASRIGSIPCIVAEGKTGVLFSPADAFDLFHKARLLWSSPERLRAIGASAREEFEKKYTDSANFDALMTIYESAMERRLRRAS